MFYISLTEILCLLNLRILIIMKILPLPSDMAFSCDVFSSEDSGILKSIISLGIVKEHN